MTGDETPEVVLGEHGKPALSGAGPSFNLSHTSGWTVLSLAAGVEPGIDVECAAARPNAQAIATRYFHPDEAAAMRSSADPAGLFVSLWTHKEAVLKAAGVGLSYGLARVRFEPRGDDLVLASVDGPLSSRRWYVQDLSDALAEAFPGTSTPRCALAWADRECETVVYRHESVEQGAPRPN